ncbi:MAG TPA: glycosyltransferase family A protein [Casimicrobiaceae bacterium]|nr:glycosyltransferase family A protein [Casimicrobiaceae bacterium]
MPMISCLTVTQEGRLPSLERSIADFVRQTERDRELVVVHDGGAAFHDGVQAIARANAGAAIRLVRVATSPRSSLGALRNMAVDCARGAYVCQWDDDDRHHPRRLQVQMEALRAEHGDAAVLADQLHLFADVREMYWDDWDNQPYPLNFVAGTLLARREAIARYPDQGRGEDTALALAMLEAGRRFARTREQGFLYVYVFDGRNSFDHAHHAAISLYHRFRGARLLRLEPALRQHVSEYTPPLGPFTMPCEGGDLRFG